MQNTHGIQRMLRHKFNNDFLIAIGVPYQNLKCDRFPGTLYNETVHIQQLLYSEVNNSGGLTMNTRMLMTVTRRKVQFGLPCNGFRSCTKPECNYSNMISDLVFNWQLG